MTTVMEVRQAHHAMLEAAERLVVEMSHLPAGVVLRCYWRSARSVRDGGCPLPDLAYEAAQVARGRLAARGVRVPHPRAVG